MQDKVFKYVNGKFIVTEGYNSTKKLVETTSTSTGTTLAQFLQAEPDPNNTKEAGQKLVQDIIAWGKSVGIVFTEATLSTDIDSLPPATSSPAP